MVAKGYYKYDDSHYITYFILVLMSFVISLRLLKTNHKSPHANTFKCDDFFITHNDPI